jgi:hypothetical protein
MEQAGYSSSQVDLAEDRITVRRAPYRRYEKPMTARRAVATASRTRHARHYNCLEFMHRKRLVSCWNRAPILIRLQKTLLRSGAVRIRVISDIELVPKGQVQPRARRLR